MQVNVAWTRNQIVPKKQEWHACTCGSSGKVVGNTYHTYSQLWARRMTFPAKALDTLDMNKAREKYSKLRVTHAQERSPQTCMEAWPGHAGLVLDTLRISGTRFPVCIRRLPVEHIDHVYCPTLVVSSGLGRRLIAKIKQTSQALPGKVIPRVWARPFVESIAANRG